MAVGSAVAQCVDAQPLHASSGQGLGMDDDDDSGTEDRAPIVAAKGSMLLSLPGDLLLGVPASLEVAY